MTRLSTLISSSCALILAAGVSACSVGPNYETPQSGTPESWAQAPKSPAADPAVLAKWWRTFDDAELTFLVERAIQANYDLTEAESRVRQARAALTVARAPWWPEIDASANYDRAGKGSGNFTDNSLGGGRGGTGNFYQAGFDAFWELDIFGGTRRAVEAAHADLDFAVNQQRAVLISVVAEVGSRYFSVRALQRRIEIARDNLKIQQENAGIADRRHRAGFASALDLANALAESSTTTAQIPLLESALTQQKHALATLLGDPPGTLYAELESVAPLPVVPPEIPVGLPSDLLQRRPDILAADADLHAETARIGVAEADLFPRFPLTAMIGLGGNTPSDLGNWRSHVWNLGAGVTMPFFDAGRRWATMKGQSASAQAAYSRYQKSVLVALQEVEDALVAYRTEFDRRAALQAAADYSAKALTLSKKLYSEGTSEFLNVINAERTLFNSQEALVLSEQAAALNLVALYKALGGGWE